MNELGRSGIYIKSLEMYRNAKFKSIDGGQKALFNLAINMARHAYPKDYKAFAEHPDFTKLRRALGYKN